MYIDHIIYSSWVSARIKCGFTTDSKFAGHLLSLEQRRQGKHAFDLYSAPYVSHWI